MSAVNIPYIIMPPIQETRWVRNGRIVDAGFQSGVANLANQIARWRTKLLFRSTGKMGFTTAGADALVLSAGSGERERWRFAFHSGPFAKEVAITFLMCTASGTDASFNPYGQLKILSPGGSLVGTAMYHYGNSVNASNVPSNYGVGTAYIAVDPDTDYRAVISDFDNARIVSACVYERSLDPDTDNGYVQTGYAAGVNIYDTDRSGPMDIARDMWLRGGAHLLNWSVDGQASPITNSLTTSTNIVDTTSTTVSSSTPGYTLDLSNCDRLSESSGVPCVLAAYGKYVITPPVSGGTLKLKDSSGTTLGTVTGFTSTAGWQTTTVNLPAFSGKYDLQFASSSGTGTFSLYAVSLYQLGA